MNLGAGARIAGFLRGDLLRAMRLTFLLALLVVGGASLAQIAMLELPEWAVLTSAVVLAAVFGLRVVEYFRVRPVTPAADVAEVAAMTAVLLQARNVDVLLAVIFFLVLSRSAVGDLRRLLPLIAGYGAGWVGAAALFPEIPVHVGALVALPVVGLLVYAMRRLLLRLRDQGEQQSALLAAVLRRLPFPVVVTGSTGEVLLTNPAAEALIGDGPLAGVDVRGPDGAAVDLGALAAAAGPGGSGSEVRLMAADGTIAHVQVEAVTADLGAQSGVVLALLDVTAQRRYEQQLQHAAYHDTLTGLPNRALLWQRFDEAERDGLRYAVLLLDLDGFKAVNDTLGHRAGDELLQGVAARLVRIAGPAATVARLGGDEFAILLPGAGRADAEALAEAVGGGFRWPYPLSTGPMPARGTVGVAVREPGMSPDDVLAAADHAMYRGKPRRVHTLGA